MRRGDIYWYSPGAGAIGHEERGGRPGILVCSDHQCACSTVVMMVPLTTGARRRQPEHVRIRSSKKISTALCEQVQSVDKSRIAEKMGRLTAEEMEAVDRALARALGQYTE